MTSQGFNSHAVILLIDMYLMCNKVRIITMCLCDFCHLAHLTEVTPGPLSITVILSGRLWYMLVCLWCDIWIS